MIGTLSNSCPCSDYCFVVHVMIGVHVCPVLSTQDQLEQHVDERVQLEVFTYYGQNRTSNVKQLAEKDIVLTTYQTLAADSKVITVHTTTALPAGFSLASQIG